MCLNEAETALKTNFIFFANLYFYPHPCHVQIYKYRKLGTTLHLELRSVTCNGAEENQAHRCDPYDLRVQEQPLFLVCSSINIFTSMGLDP